MLSELVDATIPKEPSRSIVRSYLVEALAQPGGHALLESFIGPRTGLTVGTALVAFGHGGFHPLDQALPVSGNGRVESLVVFLMRRGVRLDVEDRNGNNALVQGLLRCAPGWPSGPTGLPVLRDLFPVLAQPMPGPSLVAYSPLLEDTSGRGVTSLDLVSEDLGFMIARVKDALERPGRFAWENVAWVKRARARCVPSWEPALREMEAQWIQRAMESSLPPPSRQGPPCARF